MLRSALLSFLFVTTALYGLVPTATADGNPELPVCSGELLQRPCELDSTQSASNEICEGDTEYFSCCLYGMGVGFFVKTSRPRAVGEHPNCWQSADASATAPDTCEGNTQYYSCCLWGMGIGFFVQTYPKIVVGEHPNCWQSADTSAAASANPSVLGPEHVAPMFCDGASWTQYWECCLYGMGIGFHVDLSNPRNVVGGHSNCWQS